LFEADPGGMEQPSSAANITLKEGLCWKMFFIKYLLFFKTVMSVWGHFQQPLWFRGGNCWSLL